VRNDGGKLLVAANITADGKAITICEKRGRAREKSVSVFKLYIAIIALEHNEPVMKGDDKRVGIKFAEASRQELMVENRTGLLINAVFKP
jgi:hypothetical protein